MKAINDSHHHMFLILMRVYVCMYNKIYIYIIHCKTSYCKQTHFHALYIKPSSLVILPTLYYLPKPMPFGLLASTPSEPKIRRIHRSYMLINENIYNINRGMNEPAHQLLISSQHYCGWWMLMDVDGCWWMLMDVDGCWWMLMDVDVSIYTHSSCSKMFKHLHRRSGALWHALGHRASLSSVVAPLLLGERGLVGLVYN